MKKDSNGGLGRGLSSLLGEPEQGEDASVNTLPIAQVQPGLNQPRKNFNPEAISDLADSIRIHGIIQPLTVRLLNSGYYQIIAGERRWRAAKEAGLSEVPVLIIEADDKKVMELALIENLQREDLNPVEEARGLQTLMEEYGLTQEQVGERMGKSRPSITNSLRLLGLTEKLLQQVAEGILSAGHGRALLGAPTQRLMEEIADIVVQRQLSVRQTEALVKNSKKEMKPPKEEGEISIYLKEAEENLSRNLGRRVKINHKGNKGKIVLDYSDAHDLTDLVEILESLHQEVSHGGG